VNAGFGVILCHLSVRKCSNIETYVPLSSLPVSLSSIQIQHSYQKPTQRKGDAVTGSKTDEFLLNIGRKNTGRRPLRLPYFTGINTATLSTEWNLIIKLHLNISNLLLD